MQMDLNYSYVSAVIFRYQDKKDGEEKLETVSVEEFIGNLIKHIPDEQFKIIRHYGIYSRRIKTLSKKLIDVWQKSVGKWLVRAKRLVRRNWSERIKENTGKDPMECLVCGCYYEYKGEVCLKDGILAVKYAHDNMARACLERMIGHITEKRKKKKKGNVKASTSKYSEIYMFGL